MNSRRRVNSTVGCSVRPRFFRSMNILKILQSLEELLYELALWVILLPKTFFKVLFQPQWTYTYLISEWEKEPGDRYEHYMSPIFFWVIIAVSPYLMFFNSFASKDVIHNLSVETRFLVVASILLGWPLGVAVSIHRSER